MERRHRPSRSRRSAAHRDQPGLHRLEARSRPVRQIRPSGGHHRQRAVRRQCRVAPEPPELRGSRDRFHRHRQPRAQLHLLQPPAHRHRRLSSHVDESHRRELHVQRIRHPQGLSPAPRLRGPQPARRKHHHIRSLLRRLHRHHQAVDLDQPGVLIPAAAAAAVTVAVAVAESDADDRGRIRVRGRIYERGRDRDKPAAPNSQLSTLNQKRVAPTMGANRSVSISTLQATRCTMSAAPCPRGTRDRRCPLPHLQRTTPASVRRGRSASHRPADRRAGR